MRRMNEWMNLCHKPSTSLIRKQTHNQYCRAPWRLFLNTPAPESSGGFVNTANFWILPQTHSVRVFGGIWLDLDIAKNSAESLLGQQSSNSSGPQALQPWEFWTKDCQSRSSAIMINIKGFLSQIAIWGDINRYSLWFVGWAKAKQSLEEPKDS